LGSPTANRKDFNAAHRMPALKTLRGHAKFLSPPSKPAAEDVFPAPETNSGAGETRLRWFHILCSEQDASAFRFGLVSPRAAAHVWGKGGAHPYREFKNNTVYLAEKAKNEPNFRL